MSLRLLSFVVPLFFSAVAPARADAQNCNTIYPNGMRPVINAGADPLYRSTIVLCNWNRLGLGGGIPTDYFEINYNINTLAPNFVAYCVDPARTALMTQWWRNTPIGAFVPDPRLRAGQQPRYKFTRGGLTLDAGHMFPAETATFAPDAMMYAQFATNIVGQIKRVNGGNWARMEALVRTLGAAGSVYVLVGPTYNGAPAAPTNLRLSPAAYPTLDDPAPVQPALPDSLYALIFQPAQLGPVTRSLRAYKMPNNKTPPLGTQLANYAVAAAALQTRIGTPSGWDMTGLITLVSDTTRSAADNNCGTAIL